MSGIFTWLPDYDAEEDVATAVLTAKFGDGYEQRAQDGINSVKSKWSLTFSLRTKAEVSAIADFLRARAGAISFEWAPPGETLRKFKCTSWRRALRTDSDSRLSCTFEEVFD